MTTSHVTQSTLGGWFGLSSIKIGKILTAHGLKERSSASQEAVRDGLAKQVVMKDGTSFWVWEARRISKLIDQTLGNIAKPLLDKLTIQIGDALQEEKRLRNEGSDFVADLLLEQAFEGVPACLIGLIRERLGEAVERESIHL